MRYIDASDLPEEIRGSLPKEAQQVYLRAYNNAWAEYIDPEDKLENPFREEMASRVAWGAVEGKYEKNEKTGKWTLKKQSR